MENSVLRQIEQDLQSITDEKHGYIKAGYPGFPRLFGRDGLIVSWQLLDENPEICKRTIEILSQYQGKKYDAASEEEPGKILHETEIGKNNHPKYPWIPFPYFGSIDSTPLYVIVFYKYYQKTKDENFLNEYLPNIKSAIDWIKNKIESDSLGFLRYERKQEKGQLYHQGWKDGFFDHLEIKSPVAIVEAQGYAYLALRFAASFFPDQTEDYLKLAQKLKDAFNERFWMDGDKYFALAIDGDGNQKRSITSNPGHLLFCGILDEEKSEAVISRLFRDDLWTDYGIRTHSIKENNFDVVGYHLGSIWPHDNWIVSIGFRELDKEIEYEKIKKAILSVFEKLGYIPECYGVNLEGKLFEIERAQKIQAWSLGSVYYFLNH